MAESTRGADEQAEAAGRDDDAPARHGDVLGISDAPIDPDPDAEPRRRPIEGIEVGERATGIGDVPRTTGSTGIDMGGGGEGTGIRPTRSDE